MTSPSNPPSGRPTRPTTAYRIGPFQPASSRYSAAAAASARRGRGPERLAAPRLDLHDHQLSAPTADEVDLAAPGGEARADHVITSPPHQLGRGLLAGAP